MIVPAKLREGRMSDFKLLTSNFGSELTGVLEHLQPGAGFAGEAVGWAVGHLDGAEAAFGVGHHDGGATIGSSESCNACG